MSAKGNGYSWHRSLPLFFGIFLENLYILEGIILLENLGSFFQLILGKALDGRDF